MAKTFFQASLVLTVSEHSGDVLNPTNKFQTYIFYADSLMQLGQYSQAVSVYKAALLFKKSIVKSKNTAKPNETVVKDATPDAGWSSLCIMGRPDKTLNEWIYEW